MTGGAAPSAGRPLTDVVEVTWHRQVYRRIGLEPYSKKDGSQTTLAIWRSNCRFCGAEFDCKTSREAQVFKAALHCKAHRRRADRVPPAAPGQREFAPVEIYETDGARK
ncbi:hypothetical protein [Mesorhizobium cantuariense]|uniref:Uncharacterized protein n=1 Tax=Mesorhizobium cantuariense TaxID=1300275 RepID=A0ABV7MRS3_9HYPH